ncbi:uncharacterized protein si:ch73-127m5.2 [Betta splendens]|uniref:Uncharacterized protein si:ch73-127m5.2 n=1 Tax=Betta splendens TaxID=158456 RepID=A0A6P7L6L1_BETSP|nr:uncharacterized protein si:ch73-127m5.2 [Betta splendens]
MDQSARVVSLDAQGNMVFTVVKPVMGIFQVSSEPGNSVAQASMDLQGLSESTLVLPQMPGQALLEPNQVEMHAMQPHVQPQVPGSGPVQSEGASQSQELAANSSSTSGTQMPFAEVSSLLDPNMKGSKARKYLISYEEIKRRLQAPERMSLRSLAAYTRVSRGPASKKTLLESLNVLGLTPSTTTSVSSAFSKLTEGDTRALCDDMKDFAQDYIDYGNMAKQLIPETNTVQHWSKIIETKNHLEDMRKCFKDPVNGGAFDSVTHGLGLGMLDVALDVVVMVIEQQIRILSGAAASEPADSGPMMRRVRRRHRKVRSHDHEVAAAVKEEGKGLSQGRGRGKMRKRPRREQGALGCVEGQAEQSKPHDVLTLVSVGYETVSSGLSAAGPV